MSQCHESLSLSELESIRLMHFLMLFVVVVVLGWYGTGCQVPVFS